MNPSAPHPVHPVNPVQNSGSVSTRIADLEARKTELLRLYDLEFEVQMLEARILIAQRHRPWLKIYRAVCEEFEVTLGEILSRSRLERITTARHAAYYIIRVLSGSTLEEIGLAVGKDHGTVLYACRAIQSRVDTETHFASRIAALLAKLSTPNS